MTFWFQTKGRLTNRFCYAKHFFACLGGGGGGGGGGGFTQERFSNFSNNRFFQAEKLPEKPFQQGRILYAT